MFNFQNNLNLDITWHYDVIQPLLGRARYVQGKLIGQMETLAYTLKTEAHAQFMAEEVLYISGLTEENEDYKAAHNNLLNYFNFAITPQEQINSVVKTVAELITEEVLNQETYIDDVVINKWYEQLRMSDTTGVYKTIHTENLDFSQPLKSFSEWYNYNNQMDDMLKAAVCFFLFNKISATNKIFNIISYLLTIRLLALSENTFQRYYAVSKVLSVKNIEKTINETDNIVEKGITAYLLSFTDVFSKALENSTQILGKLLLKNEYWNNLSAKHLSIRQEKVLCYMKEQKIEKISTGTWAVVASCSADTALRDVQDLLKKKVLLKTSAGGRSTLYELNMERL